MFTPARIIFLLPLLLVACGSKTFPLSGAIDAPHGVTASQQQNDILFCKDQASKQANNDGEQSKAFLFGSSALRNDKAMQRAVFAKCMMAKGYTVSPVKVAQANAAQQIKPI